MSTNELRALRTWRVFAAVDLCTHYAAGGYLEMVETHNLLIAKLNAAHLFFYDKPWPPWEECSCERGGEGELVCFYQRGRMPDTLCRFLFVVGFVTKQEFEDVQAAISPMPGPGWTKNYDSRSGPKISRPR